MRSSQHFFVTLGGGLGDVFYLYLLGHHGWGHLKSLKKKYPRTKVTALCSTHNPQTLEFIKYNPYVNAMEDFGWVLHGSELWEKNKKDAIRLDTNQIVKNLNFEQPRIYLSKEDKEVMANVAKEKFILLHPFAGEEWRDVLPTEEYYPLVDRLIEETGLNVVVIGNSYTRTNLKSKFNKKEEWHYERDGLFNLVGNSNARICAELARRQELFIGNWSAYSCASWIFKKKTVVTLREVDKQKLKQKLSKGGRWSGSDCKMITTPGTAVNPNGIDFEKKRDEIIEAVKGYTLCRKRK